MEVNGGELGVFWMSGRRHFQARLDGSEADSLAGANGGLPTPLATINPSAVGGAGITNNNFAAVTEDVAMMAGDARLVDDEGVVGRATHGSFSFRQCEGLAFESIRGEDELRHNMFPLPHPICLWLLGLGDTSAEGRTAVVGEEGLFFCAATTDRDST